MRTNLVKIECNCITTRGQKPRVCDHNNHEADPNGGADQWHHEKNIDVNPRQVTRATNTKYWYKCPNKWCEMSYEQSPSSRTWRGSRCPFCASKRVCEWNCLLTNYPELCEEYDPENDLPPDKILPGSHTKVKWFHRLETGIVHKWEAAVVSRTRLGTGCPQCNRNGGEQMFGGHEVFVRQARAVHGDNYEYREEYRGSRMPISIYCPAVTDDRIHGNFIQTPANHKSGTGCPMCTVRGPQLLGGHEFFLKKAREVHGDKYVYNEKYKTCKGKLTIYCPIKNVDDEPHGNFLQTPDNHKAGQGCPNCDFERTESKLMTDIRDALNLLSILFVVEQTFEGLKYVANLWIDIVAPVWNLMIEADGCQHFVSSGWGGEEGLKLTQQRDVAKDYFCVKHKFNMIRIPYTKSPTQIKLIIEEAIADIKAGHQVYVTYRHYYDSLEPHLQELTHFKDVKVTIMTV